MENAVFPHLIEGHVGGHLDESDVVLESGGVPGRVYDNLPDGDVQVVAVLLPEVVSPQPDSAGVPGAALEAVGGSEDSVAGDEAVHGYISMITVCLYEYTGILILVYMSA